MIHAEFFPRIRGVFCSFANSFSDIYRENIMANRTFRVYYSQPMKGRIPRNFQIPVNTTSVVVITAAEYSPELVPPNHPNERRRQLGAANVWVSNVSVHGDDGTPNNGVEFIINADWGSPIFIVVDITVLDSPVSITHV